MSTGATDDAILELLRRAAAGGPEAALDPLLAAWERVRAPALAAAIEGVSAHVTSTRSLPPGKTLRERQAAWLKLAEAKRPEDVGVLLTDLVVGLKSPQALERIVALGQFPPDPRIARALADLVEQPPFQAGTTRPFWRRLFPLLVEHADPRTLKRLAPLSADYVRRIGAVTMGTIMKGALDAALGELRERFPDGSSAALPPGASALLAPLVALGLSEDPALRQDLQTEAELLRAIAADPRDDAPRLVYADWLLEKGDPRGEFIALQYRRHRGEEVSAKDTKREADLLSKNKVGWLGPVHKLLQSQWKSCRFERGFLAVARVVGNQLSVDAAVGHAAWGTVEEITLPNAAQDCGRLFGAQVLPALRVVRGATPAIVSLLARSTMVSSIEELEVWLPEDRQATVDALGRFPRLRALTLPSGYAHALQGWAGPERFGPDQGAATYRWLWGLPWIERLERLGTTVSLAVVGGVLADILGASSGPTVELDLALGGYSTYGKLVASRGADGRRTELTLDRSGAYPVPLGSITAMLAPLAPSAVTAFRVVGEGIYSAPDHDAVVAALPGELGRFPGVVLETA